MHKALLAGSLVIAAASANPALGQAQSAEDQLGAVQACRAIADLAERVACYDRASAPGAGQAAHPQPPATPPPTPEEQFGRAPERARPAPPPPQQVRAQQQLEQISAKITAVRSDPLGRLSFVLDNGQVWRMTESEGAFDFPSRGDAVTIRRGAVGGYRLDWGNVGVRVAREN